MPAIVFRKATMADVPAVTRLYDGARRFMRRSSNLSQWTGGYPSEADVRADIAAGHLYVAESAGRVAGVFALIIGPDPTYAHIEGGSWLNDEPYGTIHRLASDGTVGRLTDRIIDYCLGKIANLRIDTHADNAPMLRAIGRNGFTFCGIIRVADGSPRRAYHLTVLPGDARAGRIGFVC